MIVKIFLINLDNTSCSFISFNVIMKKISTKIFTKSLIPIIHVWKRCTVTVRTVWSWSKRKWFRSFRRSSMINLGVETHLFTTSICLIVWDNWNDFPSKKITLEMNLLLPICSIEWEKFIRISMECSQATNLNRKKKLHHQKENSNSSVPQSFLTTRWWRSLTDHSMEGLPCLPGNSFRDPTVCLSFHFLALLASWSF